MKISKFIPTCFAIISFFLGACINTSVYQAQATKTTLIKKSESILKSIAFADFEAVSKSVHEGRGLQFSPYDQEILFPKKSSKFPHCTPNITKFTKKQIVNFMQNKKTYVWGEYDGSGDEITFPPKLYYKEFLYDMDYFNKTEARVFDNEGLKKK